MAVRPASSSTSHAGSQPEPAKQLEDLRPILVVDEDTSILTRDYAHNDGIGAVESVEDYANRTDNGPITKASGILAEEVGAGVFKRDALSIMVKPESSMIVVSVTIASASFVRRRGVTPSRSSGTSDPMTQKSISSALRPRARSDNTIATSGSTRVIADHRRQDDLRCFECLRGAAVPEFGIGQ